MYTLLDEICDIMREYDVTFSLGDGLRPGGLADATDAAQLAELVHARRAHRAGLAQGRAGHGRRSRARAVRPDRVQHEAPADASATARRSTCWGRSSPTSSPATTTSRAASAPPRPGYHGAAMLCYVTPKEHLGLPKKDDVKQGCIAYKIAAHAADVALGIPGTRDRDDELTKARAALNWEKHFELTFDPDTARALPRRRPRRRHRLLRDVRPRLVQRPHLARRSWSSPRARDAHYETAGPRKSNALTKSNERSSRSAACSARRSSSVWLAKPARPCRRSTARGRCHSDLVTASGARNAQNDLVQLRRPPAAE